MKLTEQQYQLLSQKIKLNECPNCKSSKERIVNGIEFQLMSCERTIGTPNVLGDMDIMTLATVECKDCSNVMLFNLKTLGVVTR